MQIFMKQECIPVGCVPSAAVAVCENITFPQLRLRTVITSSLGLQPLCLGHCSARYPEINISATRNHSSRMRTARLETVRASNVSGHHEMSLQWGVSPQMDKFEQV